MRDNFVINNFLLRIFYIIINANEWGNVLNDSFWIAWICRFLSKHQKNKQNQSCLISRDSGFNSRDNSRCVGEKKSMKKWYFSTLSVTWVLFSSLLRVSFVWEDFSPFFPLKNSSFILHSCEKCSFSCGKWKRSVAWRKLWQF